MPQLAANLTLLFTELPLPQRFAAAARCGFRGVEIQLPYSLAAEDLGRLLADARLELVLHNLPCGDWEAGDRGIACNPDRRDEFRTGVELGVAYARQTGCRRLNCLAGIPPTGLGGDEALAVLVDNLRHAARRCADYDITLLVEALNTRDVPGFMLTRTAGTAAVLDAVAAPNVMIQYDAYHMQVMEGDLARTIEAHLPRIGHIQIADNPGRHEPGTGEINYAFLLRFLDEAGYRGWIGCEYRPAGDTATGLEWARQWLQTNGRTS